MSIEIEVKQLCKWIEKTPIEIMTGCGQSKNYSFIGPHEYGYRFCPYCGKTIDLTQVEPWE